MTGVDDFLDPSFALKSAEETEQEFWKPLVMFDGEVCAVGQSSIWNRPAFL